jgi:hypothetical protein
MGGIIGREEIGNKEAHGSRGRSAPVLVSFASFQEITMRSFLRSSALAASCLVMGWTFAGCSSGEDDSSKTTGATGKMDGGAMDKGKMDGAMDKGKMDGAMDKGKMDK